MCGLAVHTQAKLTLVVDGYSAPVTGGNFVRNVVEGLYEGFALSVNSGSVLTGVGATPGAPYNRS